MRLFNPARRAAAIACTLLALSACADTPVQLPATYTPTDSLAESHAGRAPTQAPCRVRLAGVEDLRDTPNAAGVFVERYVQAENAPAWVRSGLLSLSRDPRLEVSDQTAPDSGALAIKVDLLKVYMMPINTSESVNVVIRIHYGDADAPVYRGTSTGMNWTALESEARGVFDDALGRLLDRVHADLLARCAAMSKTGP